MNVCEYKGEVCVGGGKYVNVYIVYCESVNVGGWVCECVTVSMCMCNRVTWLYTNVHMNVFVCQCMNFVSDPCVKVHVNVSRCMGACTDV